MAFCPSSSSSLYVGDLDPTVDDEDLWQHFSAAGFISSIHLCRDSVTGASLRYAYLNFRYRIDASKALESFNHTMLKGKPMRIMWSQRNPHPRKTGAGNLFVKNLDLSIDGAALHEAFAKIGRVLSCKVAEENGKRKGYGYVQFESEEAARRAVESLHGSNIGDKKVYVSKFVKKSKRQSSGYVPSFTNIYVNHLDSILTDDLLKEKFSAFGAVKNAVIMKDDHGQSKGFGFVCFESPEDAKKAVEIMNGTRIGSKIIYAGRALKKCERELILRRRSEERRSRWMKFQGSNVYVKNLEGFVDDQELKNHFCIYGEVISAKVMRDDRGVSRGFGFVCFSTPDDANRAVDALHGSMFLGRLLYVAIAQRKEERRAKLEKQFAEGSVSFLSYPSSYAFSSYHTPLYYYPFAGDISQIYSYQYEPFGENQIMAYSSNHGQQSYEATLPQMASSKQRKQRQKGDWVNGITSQYPQHVPFLPSVQHDLVQQVNMHATMGQQFVKYYGGNHHLEMNWTESERRKSRLKVNKPSSFSGPSDQGFGERWTGFTGAAPMYQNQVG